MKKEEKTTGTLENILMNADASSAAKYLSENQESLVSGERFFSSTFKKVARQKGIRLQNVFLAADISEGYGYKLISQEKHTRQRDTVLRLLLGAHCTLKEAQTLLKLYGMSELYARIPRDAVLIIAFNTGMYEVEDVNELLLQHGMEPLKPAKTSE